MRVATLNVGTGTVKTALAEVGGSEVRIVARSTWERDASAGLRETLGAALEPLRDAKPDAVGHRIVHGGLGFTAPVRIDEGVLRELDALAAWAPLHNPPAVEGVRAAQRLLPGAPAVAVFDTAFHAGRPLASRLYALPWDVAHTLSLFRFGFHGLAHASLVEALAREQEVPARQVTAVTLQLGAGCSACAVEEGRSVETSMGFTPLEGLPMATRSGDVDAGVVLRLLRDGRSVDEVEDLLNRGSGLYGLAGCADLRDVLADEARGERRAALAVALFVRRIAATVGAYFTLLGGRGSLVFGGGIGARSAELRRRVVAALGAWGLELDPERNAAGRPGRLSRPGGRAVYAFETDEEPLLARAACTVLADEAALPRRLHDA